VGVSVGVSHELSSMAMSIISLYKFYDGEEKLIQRAENALQSNRLVSFTYDGTTGVIRATVQPSMKEGSYTDWTLGV